jgi:hypothetical protein
MRYFKPVVQFVADLIEKGISGMSSRHNEVASDGGFRRAHCPNVQVVHGVYTGQAF